jgi:Icc-related predicted phosphoesterase
MDSGTEYKGLKIWGSPHTPTFFNWHFMKDRGEEIKKHWDMIPTDTDILITHGPSCGVRDKNRQMQNCGCEDLRDKLLELKNLKLHAFGHIHESYGSTKEKYISVNASIMNEHYQSVNKPLRIEL